MRLLNTKSRRLEEFSNDNVPLYAILSHTWGEGEVTFQDLESGKGRDKLGYQKVRMACSISVADGFDYIWIDTCCIDKTSSAELSESINSMYKWYQEAVVCYAYLADVSLTMTAWSVYWSKQSKFFTSRWFTRGWTLQELIAPEMIIFLDQDWQEIGTKASLEGVISKITGIPPHILAGEDLGSASVAQRMSWASRRQTTRIEDLAYCLIGLFGISMPLLYGEGKKAFTRLQEEIMKISDDHSIFAWESHYDSGGILATSPAAFSKSGNIIPNPSSPVSGAISVSNKGVHLKVRFVEYDENEGEPLVILPCLSEENHVAIQVGAISNSGGYFVRTENSGLRLLHAEHIRGLKVRERNICVRQDSPAGKHPSPISKAAARGNEAVVKMLLRQRVELESKDEYGQTPLLSAAENGHYAVVRLLLERGADLWSKDRFGRTALLVATENGHHKVIKELKKKNADLWSSSIRISSRPTLSCAAEDGDDITVKLLLKKGTDPELKDSKFGQTPLSLAAENGRELVLRLLIERGVDLEAKDTKYGRTPLMWAAGNGHETLARLLLEAGADPESRDIHYSRTAMSWAAENGHEAVVRLLTERGADPENSVTVKTPLTLAAEKGHHEIVTVLLDAGAKPDPLNEYHHRGPLSMAAENGHVAIVLRLLRAGADPGFDDDSDEPTPLMLATENGHDKVVKILLSERPEHSNKTQAIEPRQITGYSTFQRRSGRDVRI